MSGRQYWIDELRSLAIALMVFANSAAYFFNTELNSFYRIAASLSAPLFVFLAGSNLIHSSQAPLKKFLIRGFSLLTTAAFIDTVLWGIVPFTTYDVLYLISFGIMICGVLRMGAVADFALGTLIILLAFVFQSHYRFEINEISLMAEHITTPNIFDFSIKRALIDGWFPIFPWVGYMFLGRWAISNAKTSKTIVFLSFILFVLLYYYMTKSQLNPIRNNYIEVFYPITLRFLLLSLSFVVFALLIGFNLGGRTGRDELRKYTLGKRSLSIYIIHCLFIAKFECFFPKNSIWFFLLFCSIQFTVFLVFVRFMELNIVQKYKSIIPLPLKKLFGID